MRQILNHENLVLAQKIVGLIYTALKSRRFYVRYCFIFYVKKQNINKSFFLFLLRNYILPNNKYVDPK